jgi:hypothetical protein
VDAESGVEEAAEVGEEIAGQLHRDLRRAVRWSVLRRPDDNDPDPLFAG